MFGAFEPAAILKRERTSARSFALGGASVFAAGVLGNVSPDKLRVGSLSSNWLPIIRDNASLTASAPPRASVSRVALTRESSSLAREEDGLSSEHAKAKQVTIRAAVISIVIRQSKRITLNFRRFCPNYINSDAGQSHLAQLE